jgi:hypothetical protein
MRWNRHVKRSLSKRRVFCPRTGCMVDFNDTEVEVDTLYRMTKGHTDPRDCSLEAIDEKAYTTKPDVTVQDRGGSRMFDPDDNTVWGY